MTQKHDNSEPVTVIGEIGGLVDEARITLGVYGAELDPAEVSQVLGCQPTSAHRRGDPRGPSRGVPSRPPWPEGAWLLSIEPKSPREPDDLVQELLGRLPKTAATWEQLTKKYFVRISFGIFVAAWNRGFELSQESVSLLANTRAQIGFDIYAEIGEDDAREEADGADPG